MPKHLRSPREIQSIPRDLCGHIVDIKVDPAHGSHLKSSRHPAKYAPGLPTALLAYLDSDSVGDPMAGTGRFFEETRLRGAANDIDPNMVKLMRDKFEAAGVNVDVTNASADAIEWSRDCVVFSPPYYPRTDRRRPNAHDNAKRGEVVGFRDSYLYDCDGFIGNPGGVNAILSYREGMRKIYAHLLLRSKRMVLVTKNWTRLGVELRLDLDTILMAQEAGWKCVARHGWEPPPSLWSRFNESRGTGCKVEDVLVFDA